MPDLLFEPVLGASGDMILGALLDLGVDPKRLAAALRKTGLDGFAIRFSRISGSHHITYGRCEVVLADREHGHGHGHEHENDGKDKGKGKDEQGGEPHRHPPHRGLTDILKLIKAGRFAPRAAARAERIFRRLAEAEAAVHGIPVTKVHFHEVGAVDSIVDILGACLALEELDVARVFCAPLPQGTGTIVCAHGILPNPAPATVQLLTGFPVVRLPIAAELTTPTAAAILSTLSEGDATGRPCRWLKVGTGHGSRQLEPGPNIIRAYLLASATPATPLQREDAEVLETDIDDDSPEATARLPDLLRTAGALDATLTPLQMKKGRPGVRLTVLAPAGAAERLARLILDESSTIGLRVYPVTRYVLPRAPSTVKTRWGTVKVKRIERPGGAEFAPEYESCRELAEKSGVPFRRILAAARNG
jgi:uncharacterized protein (TIGR00299 family) protein